MNIKDFDYGSLLSITPEALSIYATAHGWAQSHPYGQYSLVYSGHGLPDIVLPTVPDLRDYDIMVSRLIGIFSETTNVESSAIFKELVTLLRDTISVRVLDDNSLDSIALLDSLKLVNGTYKLILAAARSYIDPGVFHDSRAQGRARQYLRCLRMGHTERGSFGLTVFSSIHSLGSRKKMMRRLSLYIESRNT